MTWTCKRLGWQLPNLTNSTSLPFDPTWPFLCDPTNYSLLTSLCTDNGWLTRELKFAVSQFSRGLTRKGNIRTNENFQRFKKCHQGKGFLIAKLKIITKVAHSTWSSYNWCCDLRLDPDTARHKISHNRQNNHSMPLVTPTIDMNWLFKSIAVRAERKRVEHKPLFILK